MKKKPKKPAAKPEKRLSLASIKQKVFSDSMHALGMGKKPARGACPDGLSNSEKLRWLRENR